MLTAVYVVPLITAVSPTVALAHLQIPPSNAILLAVAIFPLVVLPTVIATTGGGFTIISKFRVISLQPPLLIVVILPVKVP